MITLSVNDKFDPGNGNENKADLYPGAGVYWIPRSKHLVLIYPPTVDNFKPMSFTIVLTDAQAHAILKQRQNGANAVGVDIHQLLDQLLELTNAREKTR